MSELGVVVVGTGFGARAHVPALRAGGFRVRALVGRDRERTARRAEAAGVPLALTSLDEALSLPGVDAVSVATPPHTHAPVALAAVDARKHVLVEKPFALDADEARAMVAAAEAAGVVNVVGHEFRFAPERALVARLIAQGAVGHPRLASLVAFLPLVADPEARAPDWWFDPARGGGWLGASGSHVVDQARTWLGDLTAVSGALSVVSKRPAHVADDSFSVLFRTAGGAQGVLQQSAGAWGPMSQWTWVAGDEGTVRVQGPRVWLSDSRGDREIPIPPDLALPLPPAPSEDPAHRFTHVELGPYTRLAAAFHDAIVAGRPFAPATHPVRSPVPATFADGLAVQEVLDAVRRAAARPEWSEGERPG